jgi:hypothetical protein
MIRTFRSLTLAFALAVIVGAQSVSAGPPETDEIFRALPDDMSACLVIEDLGPTYDKVVNSPNFQDLIKQPIIRRWLDSNSYQSFTTLLAFVPLYSGVDNKTLLHDVFGSSLVLSLRPRSASAPAVGILACRAPQTETLDKVVENLCRPLADRQVQKHEHQGYSFTERREFGNRHDFVLRMGNLLFLSDQKSAIEQVIETSQGDRSLFNAPKFQAMRRQIGGDASASLLVDPTPFQELVDRAVEATGPSARPIAERVSQWWKHLAWGAISIHLTDKAEITLDFAIDSAKITTEQRNFLSRWTEPSFFFDKLPSDAVLAASTHIDFVSLMRMAEDLSKTEPSLAGLMEACTALSAGFDPQKEILPALGPNVGFMARVDELGSLQGVLEIPLGTVQRRGPMNLTLAQSIEMLVFRPLLVFYAGDHNVRFGDQLHVETEEIEGFRLHMLSGSTILPDSYRPGFAVSEDRILFVSSPQSLKDWLATSNKNWRDSEIGRQVQASLGPDQRIKAFIDMKRVVDYLKSGEATQATDVERSKVEELASLLASVDLVTLSTSSNGNAVRTTLTLFPKPLPVPSK